MRGTRLDGRLYELTMLEAYQAEGMAGEAVFELFVRKLPPGRNVLIAAGLADAVDYLTRLAFTEDEIAGLRGTGRFRAAFVDALRAFRFEGDLDAMPEGHPLLSRRAAAAHHRAAAAGATAAVPLLRNYSI